MSKLSQEQIAWSRNMQSQVLQAIESTGQSFVADCIEVDTTTLSRMKDVHLTRVCEIMALCGLKVVPMDMHCYNSAKVEILWALAKDSFTRSQQVDDFFHEDARVQIEKGTYRPREKFDELH